MSSLGRTAAAARLWWIGLWIVVGGLGAHEFMPAWVRHASFAVNLDIVRDEVFGLSKVLEEAAGVLPMLNAGFAAEVQQAAQTFASDELRGATIGLVILVALSLAFFLRRVKPE